MIQLQRYDVKLRQISEDDIEQVRIWRNSQEVSQFMAYRENITVEMQRKWYRNVQEKGDLFFMIHTDGIDVGVINLKDIDHQLGTAEGGIFIADNRFRNSLISFRASLCINDFAFEVLRLKALTAQILDSNLRAIRFNRALGYTPQTIKTGDLRLYTLDKTKYLRDTRQALLVVLSPSEAIQS